MLSFEVGGSRRVGEVGVFGGWVWWLGLVAGFGGWALDARGSFGDRRHGAPMGCGAGRG